MKADPIVSAYAEALFRLASAEEITDRVEDELHELERLYKENAEMKEFINNPRIKAEGKKDALVELLGDKLSRVMLNHMHLIIDQERGRMLPHIAEEYYRLAAEIRAKVTGEVVTAVPISDEMRQRLSEQLGRLSEEQQRREKIRRQKRKRSKRAKEKVLQAKRLQSEKKRLRAPPTADE